MKKLENIQFSKLQSYPDNPFKVTDDESMKELTDSIREYGVLTPITVRSLHDGRYEIIAGHRRKYACEQIGIDTIPACVMELNKDEAAIALVDSNLQRENILPSERAFAYKLKLEAIKHQGKAASSQLAKKLSLEAIGESDNSGKDKVWRYIRLTCLIPEILTMVDEGKIALTPAVELSFLREQEQFVLFETMQSEEASPSLSQA